MAQATAIKAPSKPRPKKATAEVFLTAFHALPPDVRNLVLEGISLDFLKFMAKNQELWEDFLDSMTIEERKDEPTRPFSEYKHERVVRENKVKTI